MHKDRWQEDFPWLSWICKQCSDAKVILSKNRSNHTAHSWLLSAEQCGCMQGPGSRARHDANRHVHPKEQEKKVLCVFPEADGSRLVSLSLTPFCWKWKAYGQSVLCIQWKPTFSQFPKSPRHFFSPLNLMVKPRTGRPEGKIPPLALRDL